MKWLHILALAGFLAMTGFAWGRAEQRKDWLADKVGQQETHIEASDKEIQRLLIRIEGDEDFLKGALGVIGFMQSLGLIKSFQRKQA
jgi:hypothetical protein